MLKILRNFFYLLIALGVFGIAIAALYAFKLEKQYHLDDQNLDGALWSMPARVFARPLEIFVGKVMTPEYLVQELTLLEYQKTKNPIKPEQYYHQGDTVIYYAPEFRFWDQARAPRKIQVTFADGKISKVENLTSLEQVAIERLNPIRIANIFPQRKEDRILVKREDVPEVLIDALIAVEDRNFYEHFGIDIRGIMRSIYVTFIAKTDQQGASTLTQQFIKNHYLTNERKISRKIKEMLMAIVLERHVGKKAILEGYLNEIYLGQDGQRAIHGFGLASEFFFNKKPHELKLHEIALLVALVREPGNADPRRHPEYALKRRDLVLNVMAEQRLISQKEARLASQLPLDVVAHEITSDRIRFPAFVDLVYQQLSQQYSKADLTSQGLNIYTTLDPQIQISTQKAVENQLPKLERSKGLKKGFLQGAAVVVDIGSGSIRALVGSRVAGEQGFNRAISASRQVGSLIKPAVYLSALEYPTLYTLSTLVDDSPLNYTRGKSTWSPKNYNRRTRGKVLLIDALVYSYNIPTARIALDLGIDDVVSTLRRLGAWSEMKPYPSLALGAVQMTPLEVTQIYETIANGGIFQPLRAVSEITTQEGEVVDRFDMKTVRAIEPTPHYLLVYAMQEIPRRGTARRIYNQENFDSHYNFAGKTGTTDDYRDSWFAGFSGNYLTVAWVGNDQNQSTRLAGGSGGLPLWIDIMKQLSHYPLDVPQPEGIVTVNVSKSTGLQPGAQCAEATISLPFISGSEPRFGKSCYAPVEESIYDDSDWFAPPPVDSTPPAFDAQPNWFNNDANFN